MWLTYDIVKYCRENIFSSVYKLKKNNIKYFNIKCGCSVY
jgi:hypothetical protein